MAEPTSGIIYIKYITSAATAKIIAEQISSTPKPVLGRSVKTSVANILKLINSNIFVPGFNKSDCDDRKSISSIG